MASNSLLVKKSLSLTKNIVNLCYGIDEKGDAESSKISENLFDCSLKAGLLINEVVNGVFELVFMDKLRQSLDCVLDAEHLLAVSENLGLLTFEQVAPVKKIASDLRRTLADKIKSEVSRRNKIERQDPFFNPSYSKYFDFSILEEIEEN